MWLSAVLYIAVFIFDDPTRPLYMDTTWMLASYEKYRGKQTQNMYFAKTAQDTFKKESDLPIPSVEPTSSMSNVFIEK